MNPIIAGACIQSLLSGTIGVPGLRNHINIEQQIVYKYPGETFVLPDNVNTKDCDLTQFSQIKKKNLKTFIFTSDD